MELVKEMLHMIRVKSEAVSQVTFDEDYNVPDSKPDVGRMIQKKGEVQIEEVQVSEGRARIRGNLTFYLLYVADNPARAVFSLKGSLPIEENLNLEGLESGDKICLKWDIEDLSVHLINSRKLNIKAIVTFRAAVDETAEIALPVGIKETDKAAVKKKDVRVLELAMHKRDTMRVRKELQLPSNKPNIREILWQDVQVRGLEMRTEEGKVAARGELSVFVLYAGEEEEDHPLQWLEQSLPFTGEITCDCNGEMIPNMEVTVLQTGMEVKPDSDGEERVLQIDAVLEADMQMYRETESEQLLDVYSPSREYQMTTVPQTLERLLVKNYSKCRVNDRVKTRAEQGKILQVCHSEGIVKVDEEKVVENGILVQGAVAVRILYIVGDDEMPFYAMETAVPFTQVVEAKGIDEDCRYYLQTDLEQLSTTMPDSNEIEIKAVLNLNVMVLKQESSRMIESITEREPDMEKLQNMPGIVCYLVQQGDTLWDIAKRFYTTTDEIRILNDMKTDEVRPDQALMVVKKVEC